MARHDPYLDHLARVPLFAACPKKQLKLIAQTASPLDLAAGTMVIEEGTPGREFFVLVEGEAGVTKSGQRVATLHPGDFFGEMALIEHVPRRATVTADTPVTLLVLDRGNFWALLEEVPELAGKILIGLSRRLNEVAPPTVG